MSDVWVFQDDDRGHINFIVGSRVLAVEMQAIDPSLYLEQHQVETELPPHHRVFAAHGLLSPTTGEVTFNPTTSYVVWAENFPAATPNWVAWWLPVGAPDRPGNGLVVDRETGQLWSGQSRPPTAEMFTGPGSFTIQAIGPTDDHARATVSLLAIRALELLAGLAADEGFVRCEYTCESGYMCILRAGHTTNHTSEGGTTGE